MYLNKQTYSDFNVNCRNAFHSKLSEHIKVDIGYDTDFDPIFYFSEESKLLFPYFSSKKYDLNNWLKNKDPKYSQYINDLKTFRLSLLMQPEVQDYQENLEHLFELEDSILTLMKLELLISISKNVNFEPVFNKYNQFIKVNGSGESIYFFDKKEKEFLYGNVNNPIILSLIFDISAKSLFLTHTKPVNIIKPTVENPNFSRYLQHYSLI